MQTWEQIALGAIILIIIVWRFPTISRGMKSDSDEPRDWQGLLIPVGLVILFVIFLILLV